MKCSDISSRLVDFLYEELSAAERAEFDAHLTGCPGCAAEVRASSRALQRTRESLRGPLNEEPPTRVHANILAAARAAQPTPARKPRVDEKEGFFARLWKAPWLIPAMGAAGVATAVFLIKVIKNPEVFPVREPASPALVEKNQPTEERAPLPAAAPDEPQVERQAETPLGAAKDERRKAPAGKRDQGPAGPSHLSQPPQGAPRTRHLTDDPLTEIRAESKGAAPMAEQRQAIREHALASPKAAAAARALNTPGAWAEPPPPRALDDRNRRAAEIEPLLKEGSSGTGANQPRAEVLRARPQKAEEAPRPAVPPPAARAFGLPPAPAAAPARAAAAKPAPEPSEVRAKAKKASLEADDMAEAAAGAPQPTASADKEVDRAEKRDSVHKDAFAESVRKADKLYDEKKWSEAAAAYRALLAQAPKHPSATIWRQRMVYAENAKDGKPLLKAKSQISNDALDGI